MIGQDFFCNIKSFGALGNGVCKDTLAIHTAIEACAENGGGTLYFPPGTYLTGPVHLKSNMTLYMDAGATLLFSSDFDDYPAVRTRWGGCECYAYSPLVYALNAKNVTITGRGTFDGQGEGWWKIYNDREKSGQMYPVTQRDKEFQELNRDCIAHGSGGGGWKTQFLRPPLIQMMHCSNVLIEGVTLQNSPFWNTHILYCENVAIRGVTIRNPHDAPNGDGIDIDSSRDLRITQCDIDAGDDCICLKSGMDEDGRRVGRPTENIVVSDCMLRHGHGGVVMGSDISGGIRNVVITNCIFKDTDRGIRMKANRARGGFVEDVRVSNIVMERVFSPFVIHAYYCCGEDPDNSFLFDKTPKPISEKTPVFRNIHFTQITAKEVTSAAGFFYGLPEMPIEHISLRDIYIEMTRDPYEKGQKPVMMFDIEPMAGNGFFCTHVKNIGFHQVAVTTRQGASLYLTDVENVEIEGFKTFNPHRDTPVISLNRVKGAVIRDCFSLLDSGCFINIKGEQTRDIVICNNYVGDVPGIFISGEVSREYVHLK